MVEVVRLGGIDFMGAVPDSGIIRRSFSRLQGWDSGAPLRGSLSDRPASDGAFGITRAFRSARVITLDGSLLADSPGDLIGMKRELAALQGDGSPFVFSMEDESGILSSVVTISGTLAIDNAGEDTADVRVVMLAADPVRYGPTVSVSTGLPVGGGEGFVYPAYDPSGFAHYGALGSLGRVVLSNAGTAEVWPMFEVADESVVSIDSASGEVLVDGQSDGGASLLRSEWFPVPAGSSITVQFGLIDGGFEVKCIETGQAVQVARSVGASPVLTVFSASGWW